MAMLNVMTLVLCAAALGAFSWGMTFFFERSSGAPLTHTVAALGLIFAGWHVYALTAATITGERALIACALYVVSLVLFFWTIRVCRQTPPAAIFEPVAPHSLLREGPYRFVRHPFYGSYIVFWIAGWIASNSLGAVLSLVVMSTMYIHAAREEEARFSTSPFAGAHANYCRATGFLIPRLKRREVHRGGR